MKRFLTTSFILLALVVGAPSIVPIAHAACIPDPGDPSACYESDGSSCTCPTSSPDPAAGTPTKGGSTADQTNSALATVMTWIVTLFAWLVGIAAIILDNAVYYTVVTMGNYVSHLSAIGVTWRILRDAANIMFIFGFIGAGIATILNVDQYGWKTKMLPMLLMGAIFLNFSLFFTEAVVDVSNLFATQFYQQINGGTPAGQKTINSTADITNEGISSKIMNQVGLQNIYQKALTSGQVFAPGSSIIIGFMSIILFLVTAFVMFALAFILIARFVALIFYMLLSPVGFMGLAIPQMQHRASQWWSSFLGQVITAPVLMLLLYVALAVITDANFLAFGNSKPDWTGFIESSGNSPNLAGFASVSLSFLVAMGLLLVVVIKAKSMSAFGAGQAIKMAGGATFGATAWAANRTIGRGAYRLQRVARQSATFNRLDAMTGRVATRGLDRLSTGSFDVRGAKIGGGLKGLGVDAGDVAKDGFVGARKRSIEDHEKAAKAIGTAHSEAVYKATAEDKKIFAAVDKAKEDKDKAEKAKAAAEAEMVAITEAKKKDKYWTESNPGKEEEAQKKLADATTNLTTATDTLTKAEEAKKEAEKAPEKRRKESLNASKEAYAEGIQQSPVGWIAYGPDAEAAATKIKHSIHDKSDKDKVVDLLAKIGKPAEGEGGGEKKPEAAAAAKPADDHH